MIRLVALDIDGTLFDTSNQLSEANATAVRETVAAGVPVVLATSRWFYLARQTAQELGLTTPIICHNGALVKRPDDEEELLHLRLDQRFAQQTATLGDQRGYRMFTTVDHITYMRPEGKAPKRLLPPDLKLSDRHADIVARGAPTAILVFGEEAADEICQAFGDGYQEHVNFSRNYSLTYPHYLIMTHAQADKGRALQLVCRELGVSPQETLAMGDSQADAAMFDAVGYGIAMGNAPTAVQEAAVDVAPSNDEDGVAWALRKYVLG
jgi:Cof subfamily protein (haloacid dehalogenase superfamily)